MRKNNSVRGIFDCHRFLITLAFLTLLLSILASVVFAHKVNIFAYAEGDTVYTESYFSDGTRVKGAIVEVYDSKEVKSLEGKTDENGEFSFELPKKDDLRIVLLASLGHKNSYALSVDELAGIIGSARVQEPQITESQVKEVIQADSEQIKKIIDTSLDEKLKPIMRQLTKAQQKEVSFTEIVGGIGYIFGIMGIILYFVSKKREVKNRR